VEQLIAAVPQQSMLLVYPLFHISGLGASFLSPLLAGSKIVVMERWDPAVAVRLIEQERISMFTGVPTMLWDLLNSAALEDADLSSVTNIGMGGQALPTNLLDSIRAACPHSVMGIGYGLTETAGSVAMALGQDYVRKRDSAGRIMPVIETKIVDGDGRRLGVGETGEIVVRGAQVMLGYWGLEEETSAVLDEQGWFHTGDVGRIDDEDYLFIVDRKKDMVISGGENIYCAEVERVLSEIEGVAECATFGIPDARLGELLVAVVRGDGLSEDEIKDYVGERLARYKTPAFVRFALAPLPRNDLGKIDKLKLRQGWSNEDEETD
jgi:acyl-CoA synthetase (AMP-forming)/AMP-acid ligase II